MLSLARSFMQNWKEELTGLFTDFESYFESLFKSQPVFLGEANPPAKSGAYVIYDHEGRLAYIGEAKGSGGLRDRLLKKHLFGDDNHAIQRAYKEQFPDRAVRRNYIRKNVSVRWVETADAHTAVALERILILIFNPPWNQK